MVFLENRSGMYFRAHPEKCETVFGKDARENKELERRSDPIRSERALGYMNNGSEEKRHLQTVRA